MKHLKYLRYLLKHKWWVFYYCCKYGIVFQGIVHDWSKFLPSEWIPYTNSFYGPQPRTEKVKEDFDYAWSHHQHFNPHHWQYWVLHEDSGKTKYLRIPKKYVLEMVADWSGAGRAITGKDDTINWYNKNKANILLNEETRMQVEHLLNCV